MIPPHEILASQQAEVDRLTEEVARLRERAERAEAALRPFAVFLAWIEAGVEVGDLDPVTDQSCVMSIHPRHGGSHQLWVGDFRRAQEALVGLDAPPSGERPMIISREQYELGYAIAPGPAMQGGESIRREPYRLICRLPDGNYLVEDPSVTGPDGDEPKDG